YVASEADDVSPARIGAEACLDRCDGTKCVKHLSRLRRQHAVPAHLGQRVRVDLAVLPDLELSKMKAERLDLPDEVLQLAVSLSRRARAGERGLDAAEVCHEIG